MSSRQSTRPFSRAFDEAAHVRLHESVQGSQLPPVPSLRIPTRGPTERSKGRSVKHVAHRYIWIWLHFQGVKGTMLNNLEMGTPQQWLVHINPQMMSTTGSLDDLKYVLSCQNKGPRTKRRRRRSQSLQPKNGPMETERSKGRLWASEWYRCS